ncbi:hypothetical protein V3C99_010964 [Haemonchus contortus]
MLLPFILISVLCQKFSSANPLDVVYSPESFDKFRTGETRNLTIQVTSDGTKSGEDHELIVECMHEDICKVIHYPSTINFSPENNHTATFEVVIESRFLGVTHLNVTVGDEVLPGFPLRLLRSDREAKVTKYFNIFLGIFIFIISTMMGTQLEPKRIIGIARKPIGPTIGFFCQFLGMPTIGFLVANFGLPDDANSLKMALFATSTCPGGGKSSFWTIIFSGNLDLSISMTFTQTLAALFMMPLWMSTLGRHFTDTHVRIPFLRIVEGLVAFMVPTTMGMIITHYRPQYIPCIHKWIKRVSWCAMIVLSIFAIYSNYYIFWLITWRIVLCGCALPWLGYITAFIVALLLRQPFKDALTIAIETGIQNIGIAMLLMVWCLPEPESDIAVTIIFVTAIMTDKPLVIIWLISRLYKRCCKRDIVGQENDDLEKRKIGEMSTSTITTQLSSLEPDPVVKGNNFGMKHW